MSDNARAARYQRAQQIVHEVSSRTASDREAFLISACGDDAALRDEVEWLLASIESGNDDTPAAIAEISNRLLAAHRIEAVAPREYRLIERIGHGGMGQVWLAECDAGGVRQRVALKLLRGIDAPDERERHRFIAEGRILATLQHPNIAHLIDAGLDADGMPFLAMEFVDGERIDRWCDAHEPGLRRRMELFIKVCAAVEYAHGRLVIHRDLKPANILVGADGEPKLLDFGIARMLERNDAAAASTTVLHAMTPAYASPEQIEGKPLGTATDIYSLGIVLYELLTGARPFDHIAHPHERTTATLAGAITPPSRRLRAKSPTNTPTPQPAFSANSGMPGSLRIVPNVRRKSCNDSKRNSVARASHRMTHVRSTRRSCACDCSSRRTDPSKPERWSMHCSPPHARSRTARRSATCARHGRTRIPHTCCRHVRSAMRCDDAGAHLASPVPFPSLVTASFSRSRRAPGARASCGEARRRALDRDPQDVAMRRAGPPPGGRRIATGWTHSSAANTDCNG